MMEKPARQNESQPTDHLNLKSELDILVAPHAEIHPPPFTLGQLTVMAVVCLTSATTARIREWIAANFTYFTCRPHGLVSKGHDVRSDRADPADVEFGRALSSAIVPIRQLSTCGSPSLCRCRSVEWTFTSVVEARFYLSNLLPLPSPPPGLVNGPFDFGGLPPELRVRIYEMVLAYPRSGVYLCGKRVEKKLSKKLLRPFVISRNVDDEWDPESIRVDMMGCGLLHCPPLVEHLAITLVNKQTRLEALPVFFATNTFVCFHPRHLYDVMASLPPAQRELIRRVAFGYVGCAPGIQPAVDDAYVGESKSAFRMLGQASCLRRVDIVAGDAASWDAAAVRPMRTDRLPGISELVKAARKTNPSIRLHGDCPNLFKHLKQKLGPEFAIQAGRTDGEEGENP